MADCLNSHGQGGGAVIAFPIRGAGVTPTRLDRALAGLVRATQEQATAVAAWRVALTELNARTAALAGAAETYRAGLAETAARLDRPGSQAQSAGNAAED